MEQDKTEKDRIAEEIDAFRHVENIHALPDIYHWWAARFLLPRMQEVFGTGSNVLFYVHPIAGKCESSPDEVRILSIGAGDGSLEAEIAQELLERDHVNFRIECLELSPVLIGRARERIDAAFMLGLV